MPDPVLGEVEKPAFIPEMPYRKVQSGKIYDKLEPNKSVDIGTIFKSFLVLDEDNLDLERVTKESLLKKWETNKDAWTKACGELGIDIDPFLVFTLHLVETKAIDVLGSPRNATPMGRVMRFIKISSGSESVRLSDMKDSALCAEFALLETRMLQKLGVPAHLVSGALHNSETQYNEGHMYTWIGGEVNAILEGTLANKDEFPALMVPIEPATLQTLESGREIKCKSIRNNQINTYGLNHGISEGFSEEHPLNSPTSLQEAAKGL